jgi:hypothetical protein
MVHMLSLRTQTTLIAKVKAHVNIQGNESADKLAKQGTKLPHRLPQSPHEHAYSTPYHLHKDTWPDMDQTPYKGPISHLLPYITQHDKTHNLELVAQNFPNIFKWTNDPNIDPATSTNFWTHPSITDPQRTCILKFRYNQYMGNARKQLFFGPTLFPQIPVPYVTLLNPTLGNTSYFHEHNFSMPYASNVIIKRSANFANSFYLAKLYDAIFL